jgi:S1-C subfamily serine protease
MRDRANIDARRGRDREQDLRVGIQFGRITDRGLAINHLDRNSFLFNSGFRRGDVIVSVHGRPIRSDADFFRFVVLRPGERVPVVVLRDGRRETVYVVYHDVAADRRIYDNRQYQSGGAYLGVTFDTQYRDAVVIANVNPASPAQEAGLQPGDILVALNGREIRSYPEAISIVRAMRPGDELEMIVERARAERQMVALLDAPPTVRTAARPPVQMERRTIIANPPADVRLDTDGRNYDDRSRDRDRDYDNDRGRRLLPRFRD